MGSNVSLLGHKKAIGTLGYPITSKLEDYLAFGHLNVGRGTDIHQTL